eukprot:1154035-Pelagomonas_calceolata.AAC.1
MCEVQPGMDHTKIASGRRWCRAEEPEPVGNPVRDSSGYVFRDLYALREESLISAGIHTNKRSAISAFAEGFNTGAKANMVPVGVHFIHCWVHTSKGNVIDAVHFVA